MLHFLTDWDQTWHGDRTLYILYKNKRISSVNLSEFYEFYDVILLFSRLKRYRNSNRCKIVIFKLITLKFAMWIDKRWFSLKKSNYWNNWRFLQFRDVICLNILFSVFLLELTNYSSQMKEIDQLCSLGDDTQICIKKFIKQLCDIIITL